MPLNHTRILITLPPSRAATRNGHPISIPVRVRAAYVSSSSSSSSQTASKVQVGVMLAPQHPIGAVAGGVPPTTDRLVSSDGLECWSECQTAARISNWPLRSLAADDERPPSPPPPPAPRRLPPCRTGQARMISDHNHSSPLPSRASMESARNRGGDKIM